MNLAELMTDILDHACPMTDDTYYIETHCVGFTIKAIKVIGTWNIISVKKEDC